MQDGKTYKHESIFSAADGCNTCVCNNGAVDCTNAPRCHQGIKKFPSFSASLLGDCWYGRSSDGLNYELPTEMAEIKVAKKIIFSPGMDSWSSPQIIPQGDFHI